MHRRKLFLYTIFFMSGIAAGFFVLERHRYLSAACFAGAMLFVSSRFFDDRRENCSQMLAVMFLCGMLVFTADHLQYLLTARYSEGCTAVCGRVINCRVKDERLELTVREKPLFCKKTLVTVHGYNGEDISLLTGSMIEAAGEYRTIYPSDNPGCFDYSLYLKGKGIGRIFKTYGIRITESGSGPIVRFRRLLLDKRESFIGRFDDDSAGFIRGAVFGDKSDLDDDLTAEFNNNSTGHILAVSGLHIGFLFSLLKMISRKRTPAASALIIISLLIYGEMTLWSAATIRDCLVMSSKIISHHIRRHFDLLSSVCFAAICILAGEPYQMFDAGFQLSFLAMAGISFLTKPLSNLLGEHLAVITAVQLGTVPAAICSFGIFQPFAMFINIPVILLASVLVPLCIVMLMLELAAGAVPEAGVHLAELISFAVIRINHIFALGTGGALRPAVPGYSLIILYYIILFGISSEWARVMVLRNKKREIFRYGVIALLPVVMLSSCMFNTLSDDEIVFVAVGQGDCTHIRAAGHDLLIDGGGVAGYEEDGYNVGEKILVPYLLHSGAESIDAALVTHLHADHYKGITELAQLYPVGAVGVPADYRKNAEDTAESNDSVKIIYLKPGATVKVAKDVSVEVIWPVKVSEEPLTADDPNEHNTVYMINYKEKRIMVTGDLPEKDELEMAKYYEGTDRLRCDVLKVAHHGSKSSSSGEFLDTASPKIAVIQVGRNNIYGHPHSKTLEKLEERGIEVFRTDLSGAVGIDIRGDELFVDLFRKW